MRVNNVSLKLAMPILVTIFGVDISAYYVLTSLYQNFYNYTILNLDFITILNNPKRR